MTSILLIIVGILITFCETNPYLSIGLPILIVGLFPIIKNVKAITPPYISLYIRRLSSYVYFTHISIINLYEGLCKCTINKYSMLFIIVATLIVSFFIVYIKQGAVRKAFSKID